MVGLQGEYSSQRNCSLESAVGVASVVGYSSVWGPHRGCVQLGVSLGGSLSWEIRLGNAIEPDSGSIQALGQYKRCESVVSLWTQHGRRMP